MLALTVGLAVQATKARRQTRRRYLPVRVAAVAARAEPTELGEIAEAAN